jgi:Do/DeqQ family serine protease
MLKRSGFAALAVALVMAGAAWGGHIAPATQATEPQVVSSAPSITHALPGGRESYADIVKVVTPAVVTIRVEGKAAMSPTSFGGDEFFRRFFGDELDSPRSNRQPRTFRQRGLGSGVVVSEDGYILTNNHVVDGADSITVDLSDGRTFTAKVIGTDEPSDLAVIKIDGDHLKTLALANSDDVQIGDVVLAVGNPLGVGQTVTMGIVSAKGRQTDGDSYQDFIQTDAPINQGNSGGALVNMKGELVGINSQILSPSQGNIGIGFAIPANQAKRVMTDLRTNGKVRRAQLGVTIQPVTRELADSLGLKDAKGAIVSSVASGSAAEKAGIKRGDVIQSFNGQPVSDVNSLRNRVADTPPGTAAPVVVVRDGSERTMTVRLDERSVEQSARHDSSDAAGEKGALGVTVAPLTPELAARAGLPKDAHGLVVRNVDPAGRAADAGIQPGDIIQEVNRQPVQSVDELRTAVKKSSDRPALVLVQRGEQSLYLTVKAS